MFDMNSGMGMLMKSFGFDPDKIKGQLESASAEFRKVITHFDARFNAIDARLAEIEKRLPPVDLIAIANTNVKDGTNG